jgi:hypothetical protein
MSNGAHIKIHFFIRNLSKWIFQNKTWRFVLAAPNKTSLLAKNLRMILIGKGLYNLPNLPVV